VNKPRLRSAAVGAALMVAIAVPASAQLGADGDADGIADERDACLYSPRGIVVGPNGCSTPGDEDEDQVADAVDACPLSPPGAVVDAQGCAMDEDLDGVADGVDRCMSSAPGTRVDARGCAAGQVASAPPMRRAAVPVAVAPPPSRPAPVPVAIAPPPVSTAPAPAATAPPPARAAPAPATTAPTTPPPVVISASPIVVPVAPGRSLPPEASAPAPKPAAVSSPAQPDRTFYFDEGESGLGWGNSRAVRQSARELMLELEHNPALSLVVSGHGDIKFDGMSVPRVSLARATAVRDALIAAGVPAQRITMRVPGINEPRFYGTDQPRNCRVELRVSGRVAAPPPAPAAPVAAPAVATPAPAAAAVAAPAQRVFPDPPPRALPNPPSPRPAGPAPPSSTRPAPPAIAQPASAPRTLTRATVSFEPFSAVLDETSMRALNGFVQTATRMMLADTTSRITIVTGIGTGEAGATAQRLAESRAGSVTSYLASLGLPRSRIDVSNQAQTGERRADVSVVSP
jgi:outer membrane protein OmpA-like peptidoglycan-associated protein